MTDEQSKKYQPKFSGDGSESMWKEIWKAEESSPEAAEAIYSLACKCQELEAIVKKLVDLHPEVLDG